MKENIQNKQQKRIKKKFRNLWLFENDYRFYLKFLFQARKRSNKLTFKTLFPFNFIVFSLKIILNHSFVKLTISIPATCEKFK